MTTEKNEDLTVNGNDLSLCEHFYLPLFLKNK